MRKRELYGVEYEIVVDWYDNGDASCVAKTIVEEGETSVNTYRMNVGKKDPISQQPFNKNDEMLYGYALGNKEFLWNDYWEDPAPEEGE